jgi:hypothetical protein
MSSAIARSTRSALTGRWLKAPPAKFCAFPCNGGDIRRGRKQLFHNRLAPRIDERRSVFVGGRRKRTAISQSKFLSTLELPMPTQARSPITRCATGHVPILIAHLPQASIFAGCG